MTSKDCGQTRTSTTLEKEHNYIPTKKKWQTNNKGENRGVQ